MTLDQLHDLKRWHERHMGEQPLEKNVWDLVLSLWLAGWVGGPVALILHTTWVLPACLALLFLPGAYVALRRLLHRSGALRCDWIAALH